MVIRISADLGEEVVIRFPPPGRSGGRSDLAAWKER